MRPILFLGALLFSSSLYAVSEEHLPQLQDQIFKFYDQGVSKTYLGASDKEVHYKLFQRGHKTALLILPGRTEPTRKYAELVYDLKELAVDFLLWDPPGQGHSERLLEDPQKGYIDDYKFYAQDLNTLFKKELNAYEKIVVIGHSMGAGIVINFAANYPHKIKAMVLSAPMMELKTNGLPESVALMASRALSLVGKKKDYVPGGGPFKEPVPYEENRVTSSPNRYEFARLIDREDPDLYMGSATNGWLLEAIKMTRKIKRQRKKVHDLPMLFFQAGNDEFSKDQRQIKFCQKHPKCQLIRYEEAKHEMFQERDQIREDVLNKTINFLRPYL
jgi:lysophospholipase